MKRMTVIFMLAAAAMALSACEYEPDGYTEYTLPERTGGDRQVRESTVGRLAGQTHTPLSLDSGYLAAYGYDAGVFSSARASVSSGMAAARADYYSALSRYTFWSAVIDDIDVAALQNRMQADAASLTAQITSLAAQQQMSLAEYASSYSMTEEDLAAFLDEKEADLMAGMTPEEISAGLENKVEETYIAMRDAEAEEKDESYAYTEDGSYDYAEEDEAVYYAEEPDSGYDAPNIEAEGSLIDGYTANIDAGSTEDHALPEKGAEEE